MRKLAKQTMENQKGPQYDIKYLEAYIISSIHITGKKPDEIILSDDYYNWYVQEDQRDAEARNHAPGYISNVVMYMGVKLTKKSPVIIAEKIN